MASRFVTASGAFDLSRIMRSAWAEARTLAADLARAPQAFRRVTTARAEFNHCLARVWAKAKSERALSQWAAQQQAEEAARADRLATLPASARALQAARDALLMAEHNDTVAGTRLVREARARLHSLQAAA